MSQLVEVKVPDIGDFSGVPVIEVFAKPGDAVAVDDALVTLESDKATMDVPSTVAGVIKEVKVKLGDKVSEGTAIVVIDAAGKEAGAAAKMEKETGKETGKAAAKEAAAAPSMPPAAQTGVVSEAGETREVKVPDIGDFKDVPVIEVFVKPGDKVAIDDALVTLESDKATMDVPSTVAGVVKEVKVKLGDKVSEGMTIVTIAGTGQSAAASLAMAPVAAAQPETAKETAREATRESAAPAAPAASALAPNLPLGGKVHASPSVRAYGRELGVDLAKVKPTGPVGRILKEDVTAYVKGVMTGAAAAPAGASPGLSGNGLDLLPWPKVDFAKFGEIETQPLSRIKKLSGANLARNWVMIPAVTYHEDADITELEAFRVQLNKENEKTGAKLTMLAFIIKACVKALQQFPEFNSSLDGENLVLKKYFHIGFAADTPNGLVVPVLKNADKKGVLEIAAETGALARQARDGKLKPADMQGASFTISSVGGIGGTAFSPIVNAPEVAILGVSKSSLKPVWDGKAFVPRLILPLSLSADHRVIDGALATRFNAELARYLADFRRVML